jgi:cold shock CspA family protein
MSEITSSDKVPLLLNPLRLVKFGIVKWFNSRYGYGFITALGDAASYGDVFVHHSEINKTDNGQYKYLVQGEYVSFQLSSMGDDSKHKYQASDIRGIYDGPLMYETKASLRDNSRSDAVEKEKTSEDSDGFKFPRRYNRNNNNNSNDDAPKSVNRPPRPNTQKRSQDTKEPYNKHQNQKSSPRSKK